MEEPQLVLTNFSFPKLTPGSCVCFELVVTNSFDSCGLCFCTSCTKNLISSCATFLFSVVKMHKKFLKLCAKCTLFFLVFFGTLDLWQGKGTSHPNRCSVWNRNVSRETFALWQLNIENELRKMFHVKHWKERKTRNEKNGID